MTLREMRLPELKRLHETELREAFPPQELKPFAAMQTLYEAGVYHPVGAWEGERLVGYAILWESPAHPMSSSTIWASRPTCGMGAWAGRS